jgi:hypothetical protein
MNDPSNDTMCSLTPRYNTVYIDCLDLCYKHIINHEIDDYKFFLIMIINHNFKKLTHSEKEILNFYLCKTIYIKSYEEKDYKFALTLKHIMEHINAII